jgi:hypothetical protein
LCSLSSYWLYSLPSPDNRFFWEDALVTAGYEPFKRAILG